MSSAGTTTRLGDEFVLPGDERVERAARKVE